MYNKKNPKQAGFEHKLLPVETNFKVWSTTVHHCFLFNRIWLPCTAERLSISVSQQLIMTQTMLTGTKIEGCNAHACWKQNQTINYGDKLVHTQSQIF